MALPPARPERIHIIVPLDGNERPKVYGGTPLTDRDATLFASGSHLVSPSFGGMYENFLDHSEESAGNDGMFPKGQLVRNLGYRLRK